MVGMSTDDASARPGQVTLAGWTTAAASVVLVLAAFQAMGHLNTVDEREQLASALNSGSGRQLGISVAEATRMVRVGLYVLGLASVVTGVLGLYVLQRHRAARVVLTVAAVPVVLTSAFAGMLALGAVVGVGAGLLWTEPARDWFAGRPVTRRQAPAVRPQPGPAPRPPDKEWAPPTAATRVRVLDLPPPTGLPVAPAPAPVPGEPLGPRAREDVRAVLSEFGVGPASRATTTGAGEEVILLPEEVLGRIDAAQLTYALMRVLPHTKVWVLAAHPAWPSEPV